MEHDTVREFRKELAHIRDRINFLFDRLESAETEADKNETGKKLAAKAGPVAPPEKGDLPFNYLSYDLFVLKSHIHMFHSHCLILCSLSFSNCSSTSRGQ